MRGDIHLHQRLVVGIRHPDGPIGSGGSPKHIHMLRANSLSTEMRGAIEEDEVLVVCEVELLEVGDALEDGVGLVTGVLELAMEEVDEEDEGLLDITLELEELRRRCCTGAR